MRRLAVATTGLLIVAVLGWMFAGPVQFGGGAAYVTTQGNSMEPRFHSGDLAILRPAGSYRIGDIAAYNSHVLKRVVMHRIVAVEGDSFTFKGDNNSWLDPEHPSTSDVIGRLVVRVPQGGIWLERVTSPTALGILAFLLLGGGGTAVVRGRRRRRRVLSQHPRHVRVTFSPATMTPAIRVVAAVTATVALASVALGVLAWTGPTRQATTTEQKSPRGMTFAYFTPVPRSAAYDGTTVRSPDPVFRKVADTLYVQFSYRGAPGTITTAVRLSTAGGWHSTVPLMPATSFTGTSFDSTLELSLSGLQARADKAAAATGLPAGQVLITLAPTIVPGQGAAFEPTLALQLTPLQLTLAGGPSSLDVKESTTTTTTAGAPRVLAFHGWQLELSTARRVSLALLILSLLAAAAIVRTAQRAGHLNESVLIHRRYGSLLVAVQPVSTSPSRPLVEVVEFATLVRLAERLGLLILCWARSGVETYVVQDENITYRYRAGMSISPAQPAMADASGRTRNIDQPGGRRSVDQPGGR